MYKALTAAAAGLATLGEANWEGRRYHEDIQEAHRERLCINKDWCCIIWDGKHYDGKMTVIDLGLNFGTYGRTGVTEWSENPY